MSDIFNHELDAFDSLEQDHQDTPIVGLTKYDVYHECLDEGNYTKIEATIVHETLKALLLETNKGRFWIPRIYCRKVNLKKQKVTIWKGFKKTYLQTKI